MLTILCLNDHSSGVNWTLNNNSHLKETIQDKLIPLTKLIRQWKSREWIKSELECLQPIDIYSNSKFKLTCKNANFNAGVRTHIKEKPSKISILHSPFSLLIRKKREKIGLLKLNGHPKYFGIYYHWWNHQMSFKWVHFSIKNTKFRVG